MTFFKLLLFIQKNKNELVYTCRSTFGIECNGDSTWQGFDMFFVGFRSYLDSGQESPLNYGPVVCRLRNWCSRRVPPRWDQVNFVPKASMRVHYHTPQGIAPRSLHWNVCGLNAVHRNTVVRSSTDRSLSCFTEQEILGPPRLLMSRRYTYLVATRGLTVLQPFYHTCTRR